MEILTPINFALMNYAYVHRPLTYVVIFDSVSNFFTPGDAEKLVETEYFGGKQTTDTCFKSVDEKFSRIWWGFWYVLGHEFRGFWLAQTEKNKYRLCSSYLDWKHTYLYICSKVKDEILERNLYVSGEYIADKSYYVI